MRDRRRFGGRGHAFAVLKCRVWSRGTTGSSVEEPDRRPRWRLRLIHHPHRDARRAHHQDRAARRSMEARGHLRWNRVRPRAPVHPERDPAHPVRVRDLEHALEPPHEGARARTSGRDRHRRRNRHRRRGRRADLPGAVPATPLPRRDVLASRPSTKRFFRSSCSLRVDGLLLRVPGRSSTSSRRASGRGTRRTPRTATS